MSLQMAWNWIFVVTLGATEWFITAVGSFMSLQTAWCWGLGATEWFINAMGSFKSLNLPEADHFCHTGNSWMVYHQCGFFHVSLNGLTLNICCHTGSNWMVYNRCRFFHVSSNCLMLRTGSNWMDYHCCGFYLVHIQNHKKSPEVQRMFCLPSRKLNWHTTQAYQMCCS